MGTLDRPSSGDVIVAGHRVSALSDSELSSLRAHHIGFVFQQFHLLGGLSAIDNVADGLLYTGRPRNERRELAELELRRIGMGHRLDQIATKLSGGERQRVATARAVVGKPSIILADEPTGSLDTKNSEAMVELITEVHAGGSTIVVITHNRDIAERFFAPREVDALFALPDEQHTEAFFRCWTRKEAYIKAKGAGLAIPLASFAVSLAPEDPAELLWVKDNSAESKRWNLTTLDPDPTFAACIATEGKPQEVHFGNVAHG